MASRSKARTAADVLAKALVFMGRIEAEHRFSSDDYRYAKPAFERAPDAARAQYAILSDLVDAFDMSAWNYSDPMMDRAQILASEELGA